MNVLGIETSCDETAAAVVRDGWDVLSNIVESQTGLHEKFSGVVPEIACRRHVEVISHIIREALDQADMSIDEIDRIAVTNRPGLIGALLVGLSTAKAMAYARGVPLVAVNHIEAHAFSSHLSHTSLQPPYVSLVVSGGHTSLYHVRDWHRFERLGATLDDAAGEAYDKVAKILGLGYPGGPAIDRYAQGCTESPVRFPRPYLDKPSLDFSFSGLKTAVLYHIHPPKDKKVPIEPRLSPKDIGAIAKGFQDAVIEVLVHKSVLACQQTGVFRLALGGGVACNQGLRQTLQDACKEHAISVCIPRLDYCTDNAAMIAGLGAFQDPLAFNDLMDVRAQANV